MWRQVSGLLSSQVRLKREQREAQRSNMGEPVTHRAMAAPPAKSGNSTGSSSAGSRVGH